MHQVIASGLGIGLIGKGGGSLAALFFSLVWYFLPEQVLFHLVLFMLILILGTWSSFEVEEKWGHDSAKVVVDEIAGMYLSLIFLPKNWMLVAVAFLLFRFFDIAKPFFIRKAEKLKSGFGVMADDLLAGFYTQILLRGMIYLSIL